MIKYIKHSTSHKEKCLSPVEIYTGTQGGSFHNKHLLS